MSDFLGMAKNSFTGAVYLNIAQYTETKSDDHIVTKVAKITGNFVVSPVFAVAMVVESVVRALLSIPAKLVHLFIPKSLSEGFNEHVLHPLTFGSAVTAGCAGMALSSLILNFFPQSFERGQIGGLPVDLSQKVFMALHPAIAYQFFN